MKRKLIIALVASISLSACSTTLKPTELNEVGYFSTGSKLKADEIITREEFKDEYKKLVYVKTDEKNTKLNSFYIGTVKNMGIFDKVLSKEEMEALIIESDFANSGVNISDRIGLKNLSDSMGTFLVVEPYAEHVQGYNFKGVLKAVDPSTGKNVLHLENAAFNWAGLDKPLFFPLFNGFIDWANNRPIETKETEEK